MQGMEFVKDPQTREPAVDEMTEMFEETRKRGLLIGKGGLGNAFRLTPPLVAQREHVDEALAIIDESLAAVSGKF